MKKTFIQWNISLFLKLFPKKQRKAYEFPDYTDVKVVNK